MGAVPIEALQTDGPVLATLIRIDLPTGPVFLTDGGFVDFADDPAQPEVAHRFLGDHPVYGVLAAVSSIRNGAEAQATRVDITIHPATDEALATLAAPATQGSRVQWWEGTIDRTTGQLIGVPDLQYDGEIDKPRLGVGGARSLVLNCGSQSERQLEPNADWRLNHAFHTRIWGTGELGLIHMTNVLKKSEWRERPPNPGLFKRLLNTFVPLSK